MANFSDFSSPFGGEYFVPNWPETPSGMIWKEMSQSDQGRVVESNLVGREGIFSWEAKVYALFPDN